MLNFKEEFLKPEIRDNFYIDATMKSMWAAMLEVLARISAICEKYNIQWYAAYGTLLGAIRHEGFVPWDDDMDIWVMRDGYNKLMEVLPKELPEGYMVQSCFSGEGYSQYHTCVNNGRGISVQEKWLEEYHGCPFTVGLDIFPLDYLPRNEGERDIQKKLFEILGRAAALGDGLGHNKYTTDEEVMLAFQEMMEAKEYIEEFCGFKIDDQLIEEGKWKQVVSEFWKCAHYVAGMYGAEDADYLVEYMDYVKWENKKFPKEWFAETYSADYEEFMVPVPNGYDQLLRTIYGDYRVKVKNSGLHEYPFYLRQLRELRNIVRQRRLEADPTLAQKPEDPEQIYPANWRDLIQGKKVILFEDGIQIYMEHDEKGIEKLKEVLETFKQVRDKVIVWWRPQRLAREALTFLSPALYERYRTICEEFQQEAWGIFDASDDEEFVEGLLDAYYGEMNARVKRLEGKKPIMIEVIL